MMRFKEDLFRATIRKLEGGEVITFGPEDGEYRDWLAKRSYPDELVQFLIENALNHNILILQTFRLFAPKDIRTYNSFESFPEAGFLCFGTVINGDYLVVDYSRGEGVAGFVSHELMGSGGPEQTRRSYIPAARSIGEMLHMITQMGDFPYDYFSALKHPILYDVDAVRKPIGPCLGNTVEAISRNIVSDLNGRLIDHPEIEERLRAAVEAWEKERAEEESYGSDFPIEEIDDTSGDQDYCVELNRTDGSDEWIPIASIADDWSNDMQTVVFNFRRDYLGGHVSLQFTRDLLRLSPDRYEYFEIRDRIYMRLWWEPEHAKALVQKPNHAT